MDDSNADIIFAAKVNAIFLDQISRAIVELDKEWDPASEKLLQSLETQITQPVQVRKRSQAKAFHPPLVLESLQSLFEGLRDAVSYYKNCP